MRLAAGSWPWLLRHEMRLAWRGTGWRSNHVKALLVVAALLVALMSVIAGFVLRYFDASAPTPAQVVGIGVSVFVAFSLMLSHGITRSVEAFFDRGDLDLLLSSPLPPRSVLVVRSLGVALAAVSFYVVLLTPIALGGVFAGNARLLAVYPALLALGLLAASAGMVLTLLLVRWLGARRARTVAQVLGAVVGAGFFLAFQSGNLLGDERVGRWTRAGLAGLRDGGLLGSDSVLWLPARAMLGAPLELAVLVFTGLAAFTLATAVTARRFLAGTQDTVTAERPAPPSAPGTLRFRGALTATVLFKEWKLIGRDPQLIAHTLLQTLYLLPLVFIGSRHASALEVVVPGLAVTAATLASGLGWITVAAEDAPELIASSPASVLRVYRLKLLAALLPVWLLVAPAALAIAFSSLWAAAVCVACVLGSTASAGIIQIGMPKQAHRRDMRRRGQGNFAASLLEGVAAISWGAVAWCAVVQTPWAALPAVAALAAPAAAVRWGRERREAFGLA